MLWIGLDDTDLIDTPGTNKLALHIVTTLSRKYPAAMITRHQLLQDPRVPCTNRNGCVAIRFTHVPTAQIDVLRIDVRNIIRSWAPVGSDPGLCVASHVPLSIQQYGRHCQHHLVSQNTARRLANNHKIFLEGLGGTEDGVIGALAAVGLHASSNDGRVIYRAPGDADRFGITGLQSIQTIQSHGVDDVRSIANGDVIQHGTVNLGKRLRPNLRQGRVVLYVEPNSTLRDSWNAVRRT